MTMTMPGTGTRPDPRADLGPDPAARAEAELGPIDADDLEAFLTLSATLTGYSRFRLLGTGQAEAYFRTARDCAGEEAFADLLAVSRRVHADAGGRAAASGPAGSASALDHGVRAEILSDERRGPVARNLIKMWFVGTWYQLPQEWRDLHGSRRSDVTHVVSPASYTEGLLWPTIGANPPGAKAPGYGTWADPPAIDA